MSTRTTTQSVSRRRTRLATALGAVLLAVVAPRLYAQVRIGVVDIRRAVTETAEGRAASDAIKIRYDARQTELNSRTHAIEALKARIEHPTAPIPPARLQKLAQQYQRQVMELQQLGQQYTQELQQLESELTKGILARMQPIVREVGQTDNYQIIVDEQVVHFAPANLNLTDRVIQLYNQRNPHTAAPTPPTPPAGRDAGAAAPQTPAGAMDAGVAAPPQTPAAGTDAGRRALPGVFYRRDG